MVAAGRFAVSSGFAGASDAALVLSRFRKANPYRLNDGTFGSKEHHDFVVVPGRRAPQTASGIVSRALHGGRRKIVPLETPEGVQFVEVPAVPSRPLGARVLHAIDRAGGYGINLVSSLRPRVSSSKDGLKLRLSVNTGVGRVNIASFEAGHKGVGWKREPWVDEISTITQNPRNLVRAYRQRQKRSIAVPAAAASAPEAAVAKAGGFDESEHPRGRGGRFAPKGEVSASRSVAVRPQTPDPVQESVGIVGAVLGTGLTALAARKFAPYLRRALGTGLSSYRPGSGVRLGALPRFKWREHVAAFRYPGGGTFESTKINAALRRGDPKNYRRTVRDLTSAIDRASLHTPVTAWRGVSADFDASALRPGRIFSEAGFMSTTPKRREAMKYAGSRNAPGTLFRIELPKGAKALPIEELIPRTTGRDLGELVLKPKSRFRVLSVGRDATTGRRLIHVQMLDEVAKALRRFRKAGGFDESEHPRGRGGRFAPKGGGGSAGSRRQPDDRAFTAVGFSRGARREAADAAAQTSGDDDRRFRWAMHQAMADRDPLYQAQTTDVIPEERGRLIGPALGAVGGAALGGLSLAAVGARYPVRNSGAGLITRAAAGSIGGGLRGFARGFVRTKGNWLWRLGGAAVGALSGTATGAVKGGKRSLERRATLSPWRVRLGQRLGNAAVLGSVGAIGGGLLGRPIGESAGLIHDTIWSARRVQKALPFDESEHPRGRGGRFAPKGGGAPTPSVAGARPHWTRRLGLRGAGLAGAGMGAISLLGGRPSGMSRLEYYGRAAGNALGTAAGTVASTMAAGATGGLGTAAYLVLPAAGGMAGEELAGRATRWITRGGLNRLFRYGLSGPARGGVRKAGGFDESEHPRGRGGRFAPKGGGGGIPPSHTAQALGRMTERFLEDATGVPVRPGETPRRYVRRLRQDTNWRDVATGAARGIGALAAGAAASRFGSIGAGAAGLLGGALSADAAERVYDRVAPPRRRRRPSSGAEPAFEHGLTASAGIVAGSLWRMLRARRLAGGVPRPMVKATPTPADLHVPGPMGSGRAKVRRVLREFKAGTLRSASGAKVTSRRQAIAIALSEARRIGKAAPGWQDSSIDTPWGKRRIKVRWRGLANPAAAGWGRGSGGALVTKAEPPRQLRRIDEATAHPPFPYDPNFLANLREDQKPRYYGALTGAKDLPRETLPLDGLIATQNRVDTAKCEAMCGTEPRGAPPVVVRIGSKHFIADGHHRLVAAWLDGADEAEVGIKDLTEVSNALKSADTFTLRSTIAKVDADKRLAFGFFSIVEKNGEPVVDLEGDVIAPDELEKAAYAHVLDARIASENHVRKGVGRLVESVVFTPEKQAAIVDCLKAQGIPAAMDLGCTGWWGGYKVDCDKVWKAVKSGEYVSWSIGGAGVREKIADAEGQE